MPKNPWSFLDALINQNSNTFNQQSVVSYETQGGGGQGGQSAKRLYYPGTQGGFASVGSGIGGQQNILDDLLKKLQG